MCVRRSALTVFASTAKTRSAQNYCRMHHSLPHDAAPPVINCTPTRCSDCTPTLMPQLRSAVLLRHRSSTCLRLRVATHRLPTETPTETERLQSRPACRFCVFSSDNGFGNPMNCRFTVACLPLWHLVEIAPHFQTNAVCGQADFVTVW